MNDFNDDYGLEQPDHISNQGNVPPVNPAARPSPLDDWLSSNSAVYAIVKYFAIGQDTTSRDPILIDPFRVDTDGHQIAFGRPYVLQAADLSNPHYQAGLEITQQSILDAQAKLAEIHAPLVVVLIPTKEEMYRRWTEASLGADWFTTVGEGRLLMLKLCAAHDLVCLDLAPALIRRADEGELLYWPGDDHLNPAGNQIVADTVWQFLAQLQSVSDN